MMVSETYRLMRKPGVPWKELDGIAIILLLDTGDYFELDPLGLEIWKMLDGETGLPACVSRLAALYDAPTEVLEADVQSFVQELIDRQVVTIVSQ